MCRVIGGGINVTARVVVVWGLWPVDLIADLGLVVIFGWLESLDVSGG